MRKGILRKRILEGQFRKGIAEGHFRKGIAEGHFKKGMKGTVHKLEFILWAIKGNKPHVERMLPFNWVSFEQGRQMKAGLCDEEL